MKSRHINIRNIYLLLTLCVSMCAPLGFSEDFTNATTGKVYSDVSITRVEPDGVTFRHLGGIAKLFFYETTPDVQERYGYDREKAVAYHNASKGARSQFRQNYSLDQNRKPAPSNPKYVQEPTAPFYVYNAVCVKDKSIKVINGLSIYMTDPSITGQGNTHLRRAEGGLYRVRFDIRNNTDSDIDVVVRFGDYLKHVFLPGGGRKEGEEISGDETYSEMYFTVGEFRKAVPLVWREK